VDYAADTVDQSGPIEIDEQAEGKVRNLQLGEELSFVNGQDAFDCLDLHHNYFLYDQIQPIT